MTGFEWALSFRFWKLGVAALRLLQIYFLIQLSALNLAPWGGGDIRRSWDTHNDFNNKTFPKMSPRIYKFWNLKVAAAKSTLPVPIFCFCFRGFPIPLTNFWRKSFFGFVATLRNIVQIGFWSTFLIKKNKFLRLWAKFVSPFYREFFLNFCQCPKTSQENEYQRRN